MTTEQLHQIRPLNYSDLAMVLDWRNHPDVRMHMLMQHEISKEEHEQWFFNLQNKINIRVCIVEVSKVPIGLVQFKNIVPSSSADWGFYVAPDTPKGTGTILGRIALDFAFHNLNLKKICGQVLTTNDASIRFHEKLGFKHEGTQEGLVCFGLYKQDWAFSTTRA